MSAFRVTNDRMLRSPATVRISHDEIGRTSIKVNGVEVAQIVANLSVEQRGGNRYPHVILEVPAVVTEEMMALLDIKIIGADDSLIRHLIKMLDEEREKVSRLRRVIDVDAMLEKAKNMEEGVT